MPTSKHRRKNGKPRKNPVQGFLMEKANVEQGIHSTSAGLASIESQLHESGTSIPRENLVATHGSMIRIAETARRTRQKNPLEEHRQALLQQAQKAEYLQKWIEELLTQQEQNHEC